MKKASSDQQAVSGGQWEIVEPHTGRTLRSVQLDSGLELESKIAACAAAYEIFRNTSRAARADWLWAIAKRIADQAGEFSSLIVEEIAKPIDLAKAEVARAVQNFELAAQEALRWDGKLLPLDGDPNFDGVLPALCSRVPRGPVLAISPFNFPLNLAVHKVAPALALGTTVLLKPAPQAPSSAILLQSVIEAARRQLGEGRIPPNVFQVTCCDPAILRPALADPRLRVLSFTGSDKTGELLASLCRHKKVLMELGGNAAVYVHADADLELAAARSAYGAFAFAGQICISVQRIFVHAQVAKPFIEILLKKTRAIKVGAPVEPGVVLSSLISDQSATKVLEWVRDAVARGASVLAGGKLSEGGLRSLLQPTLLSGVPSDSPLVKEEAFAPLALIESVASENEAFEKINASRYGLQAGVFSQSMAAVEWAMKRIDAGGVWINEVPTVRADALPYGGMKDSGIGREGIRFAMEDYSEWKSVMIRR